MQRSKRIHLFSCLLLACLLLPGAAMAQERILSFDSNIQIHADASMSVTETIRVRAEGNNIRRGIFRDFPTIYTDRLGNTYRVGFDVVSVSRDGLGDSWRTENLNNGTRLYIGNPNIFLSPGEYTYQIRYNSNRQIGFFAEHDELYWNVTGNGWGFTIEQAQASVSLPADIPAQDITMEGYTGPFGAAGQAYTAQVFDGGGSIQSTRQLNPAEGLTLVITWPKGILTEPGKLQKLLLLLDDNKGFLISLVTLIAVLIYMYLSWSKVGRDPQSSAIFPHYEPPEGYSPASARYISRMKYDTKTLTAAIINLAVKGYLEIRKKKTTYILEKKSSNTELAPGERIILQKLFSKKDTLELKQDNRKQLTQASSGHRKALRREYFNKYFFSNSIYLIPSVAGTLIMFLATALTGNLVPLAIFIYLLILLVHFFYAWLLKAPSIKGRHLLDKLEGFKMYLEVAEKDDLNLQHPPDLTPQLFEKYLPFAIALGVEQAWAEQFTRAFAALQAQTGNSYHPIWYHGAFNSRHLDNFSKDVSKGFTAAISSASTPPSSSSGAGGGGFSGGGGGGGGGGGW